MTKFSIGYRKIEGFYEGWCDSKIESVDNGIFGWKEYTDIRRLNSEDALKDAEMIKRQYEEEYANA